MYTELWLALKYSCSGTGHSVANYQKDCFFLPIPFRFSKKMYVISLQIENFIEEYHVRVQIRLFFFSNLEENLQIFGGKLIFLNNLI